MTVQINFKHDFNGNFLLMVKENDIKIIMDLMMGGGGVPAPGELTDMHLSCISEVMNQMMGSSAIALTDMIQKTVDINPPKTTQVTSQAEISKIDYLPFQGTDLVLVVFHFEVQGLIKSIMICIFPLPEVKYICDHFVSRKNA